MTTPGHGWNEENISETPAVERLRRLGYTYVAPELLDVERESFKDVVLTSRLVTALRRRSAWSRASPRRRCSRRARSSTPR
jgi:type I restriction enzyme R subunit